MAIQNYCVQCRSSFELSFRKCPKCGDKFSKYRVSVSVKGRRVNRLVDNLKLAKEAEASLKTDMLREEFKTVPKKKSKVPTINEVWNAYLPWAKVNKKTWDDDQYHYHRHIEPRFGNKPLDAISPLDVEKMKNELGNATNMNGKPFAPQSIKHYLKLLRRLYVMAQQWELYQGPNPLDKVSMPKVDNQKNEFLSQEESARLFKVLETWPCKDTVDFVKFAMFTGLRRGELMKLQWKDVDFDRGLVTLRNPKGGKTTTLPISQTALDILRGRLNETPYVFPGKDGQQRTHFREPWERIRKAAELPPDFRFHGLRHHFASTLVSNGVDLMIVKELLTHKDIATTQRYAHLSPSVLREAALKSSGFLKA